MSNLKKVALVLAVASVGVLFGIAVKSYGRRTTQGPMIVLWAWERPEDLRFLASPSVGSSQPVAVAFLAGSIYLERQPVVRPRLQPLKVAPSTHVIAVVRLELTPTTPTSLDEPYMRRVVKEILVLGAVVPAKELQIDFDALASQRQFYRELLQEVRRQLPASVQLTITALGSWCASDDWLHGLPIDDAVPMMFRMGPDRTAIEESLAAGNDFHEPMCRHSIGVSTDEPWPATVRGRRVYVFSPKAWSESSFASVKMRLQP